MSDKPHDEGCQCFGCLFRDWVDDPPAIAMEAGTDETRSGSARQGDSAGRNGIAQGKSA